MWSVLKERDWGEELSWSMESSKESFLSSGLIRPEAQTLGKEFVCKCSGTPDVHICEAEGHGGHPCGSVNLRPPSQHGYLEKERRRELKGKRDRARESQFLTILMLTFMLSEREN